MKTIRWRDLRAKKLTPAQLAQVDNQLGDSIAADHMAAAGLAAYFGADLHQRAEQPT